MFKRIIDDVPGVKLCTTNITCFREFILQSYFYKIYNGSKAHTNVYFISGNFFLSANI